MSSHISKFLPYNELQKLALSGQPEITISDDGYWVINGVKTDTKAEVEVPVQSVNGKTGDVVLTASDVGARPNTWTPTHQDVGAEKSGTAASTVSSHNTNTGAHNDIRLELATLATRINAALDSDDTTLDELSEIVAYIKSNKTLIDSITTSKVNVADIVNDLASNVTNKPLSAAQGVALKDLIDVLSISKLDASALTSAITTALAQAKASGDFDGKDGKDGTNGVGISSIAKTGTNGLEDTYTITFTDNTSTTFTVTNGTIGKDGTSVTVKNVSESPDPGGENVVTFSDNNTMTVKNGLNGNDGKSAYAYARDGGYLGTEAEFADDINPDNLKTELSHIVAPEFVSSIDEMTDTSKHYVLDGYIYSYKYGEVPGKSYTDLYTYSSDNINKRINSQSQVVGENGYIVIVDYPVDVEAGSTFTLRTKGVQIHGNSPPYGRIMLTDGSGIASPDTPASNITASGWTVTEEGDGVIAYSKTISDNNSRLRCVLGINAGVVLTESDVANVIVTVNEEIKEGGTVGGYTWVNSGITYAPTFKTDLIGVLGENGVIYLSDNALPKGTYTLKHSDKDYAEIGKYIVE